MYLFSTCSHLVTISSHFIIVSQSFPILDRYFSACSESSNLSHLNYYYLNTSVSQLVRSGSRVSHPCRSMMVNFCYSNFFYIAQYLPQIYCSALAFIYSFFRMGLQVDQLERLRRSLKGIFRSSTHSKDVQYYRAIYLLASILIDSKHDLCLPISYLNLARQV